MSLVLNPNKHTARELCLDECDDSRWPAEVEFILSALEAARAGAIDRRRADRMSHRALGRLRLYSDSREKRPWEIYSRDATPRSMGFITRHRLPLGYGGVVKVTGPAGEELTIECTVRRCRETVNGWFEGSLSFNREQFAFCTDEAPAAAGRVLESAST